MLCLLNQTPSPRRFILKPRAAERIGGSSTVKRGVPLSNSNSQLQTSVSSTPPQSNQAHHDAIPPGASVPRSQNQFVAAPKFVSRISGSELSGSTDKSYATVRHQPTANLVTEKSFETIEDLSQRDTAATVNEVLQQKSESGDGILFDA